MSTDNISVRRLQSTNEFHRAQEAQRKIWGMPDHRATVPVHALITADKNGGLVLGAFDGSKMVGYLFGFLGFTTDGKLKHCSHMMGVVPAYRGQGLSIALKQHQRQFVLDQGLDLITWTYDPLEAVNGYLNIAKLGAVCRTYVRDLYGEIPDELNRGLPTDRFEVQWWIRSERAEAHATGEPAHFTRDDVVIVNDVAEGPQGLLRPTDWQFADASTVAVEFPARIQTIKSHDSDTALDWRLMTREIFETYFNAGYTVVDVIRDAGDGQTRWFYVLTDTFEIE